MKRKDLITVFFLVILILSYYIASNLVEYRREVIKEKALLDNLEAKEIFTDYDAFTPKDIINSLRQSVFGVTSIEFDSSPNSFEVIIVLNSYYENFVDYVESINARVRTINVRKGDELYIKVSFFYKKPEH